MFGSLVLKKVKKFQIKNDLISGNEIKKLFVFDAWNIKLKADR